jgi:hypothetical protein
LMPNARVQLRSRGAGAMRPGWSGARLRQLQRSVSRRHNDGGSSPRRPALSCGMARPSGTTLRPGDVLELPCEGSFAYFSYLGKHPLLGDTIWILPRLHSVRPPDSCALFSEPGYYAFYGATAAARHGEVRKMAFCPEAMRPIPRTLRYALNRAGGRVLQWRIADGAKGETVSELTPEQRDLPIASIWNHAALLARIAERWTPARDGRGP